MTAIVIVVAFVVIIAAAARESNTSWQYVVSELKACWHELCWEDFKLVFLALLAFVGVWIFMILCLSMA